MENDINDKEVNLENTNKHTKIQKLFKNDFFQIYFFVFLVLFFLDNYQILFSSIESVFLDFNITNHLTTFKGQKLACSSLLSISFFIDITEPLLTLLSDKFIDPNDAPIMQAIGFLAFVIPIIFIIVLALILSSVIIAFKQIKNFILHKIKFNLFFYILFFICIYAVCMIIIANAVLTPFGHMFIVEKLNMKNIQVSIIIALFAIIAFKFLIHFKLKDKK